MKKYLPGVFASLGIVFTASLFVFSGKNVIAAPATHVVISEVQTRGDNGASDEFVELFNPTDGNIDLTGWTLARISSSSGTESNLIASIEGTIPSMGYFLIGQSSDTGYNDPVVVDDTYALTLSDVTTVLVYDNSDPKMLVDKVGLGNTAQFPETAPASSLIAQDPPADSSIERKPCGEDTDDNSVDFIFQQVSNPQNSQSETEEQSCSTQTPSPTATPTASPSSSPSASPTATATPTPVATATPLPTVTPTFTPKPTFKPLFMNCGMEFKLFNFGFFYLRLPLWKCS